MDLYNKLVLGFFITSCASTATNTSETYKQHDLAPQVSAYSSGQDPISTTPNPGISSEGKQDSFDGVSSNEGLESVIKKEEITEEKPKTFQDKDVPLHNGNVPLQEILMVYKLKKPQFLKDQRRIVVYKKRRELGLYFGNELIKQYPVGLAFLSSFSKYDKRMEGDHQTPEGEFRLVYGFQGKYGKSLLISYPTNRHAKIGLDYGLINKSTYQRIAYANDHCLEPPQNTKMGGNILIHGGGGREDWTNGCIALDDKPDMDEIYSFGRIGCSPVRDSAGKVKLVPNTLVVINP